MRVGVIGAGPSGLVTAKVLKHDGFEVAVFEKEATVGGVWAASRAYPGLGTNNPRETYVFSDAPHADTTDDFPSARQVREYLEAYVDRAGLGPNLHLGTEVLSVARRARGGGRSHPGFRMVVRRQGAAAEEERYDVDFVAVCNGVLSEPYLPEFEGAERGSEAGNAILNWRPDVVTELRRSCSGSAGSSSPPRPSARPPTRTTRRCRRSIVQLAIRWWRMRSPR